MRVVVIGSGNVAEAFAIALANSQHDANTGEELKLCQVWGRNKERISEIYTLTGLANDSCCEELIEADLYIVAVSDDAVSELTSGLDFAAGSVVVHTAGCVEMAALSVGSGVRRGVLYPLQSFSRGRHIDFNKVPLFIEAEESETLESVRSVAQKLSRRVVELDSAKRRELHLAAVFGCNFVNAMLSATHEILNRSELEFGLFEPLIRETINKACDPSTTPMATQTGAARRGDIETMERHEQLLNQDPPLVGSEMLIEIYKTISKYIWETSKRI